jgi:hypothetical protein
MVAHAKLGVVWPSSTSSIVTRATTRLSCPTCDSTVRGSWRKGHMHGARGACATCSARLNERCSDGVKDQTADEA